MNLRLPTVAGFLAAASLLSGSAFAFAPEFSSDLPTVIITDQLKNPSTLFDPGQGTTHGIFRYTNAFDMFDYISLNGNNRSDVRLLFNEFPNATTLVPNDRSVGTLLINDQRAFANGSTTFPTSSADFPTASKINASATNTGTGQGPITFQNRDFTPTDPLTGSEVFDYIGDVTGYNLSTSGPQTRVVQLYLSGSPSTAVSAPKNFTVITKIGVNGDQLTTPSGTSNPFTAQIANSTDFSGWAAEGIGELALIPTSAGYNPINLFSGTGNAPTTSNAVGTSFTDYTGFTLTPALTPGGAAASSGTTSLSAAVAATKTGYIGFGRPLSTSGNGLVANKLYRLRSKIASSNTTSREEFRVRFGDETLTGQSSSGYIESATATGYATLPATATDYYSYLLTKGAGSSNAFQIFYEVISLGNSQTDEASSRGQDYQLTGYELDSADISNASFGTPVVKFNEGGAVTLASGETAPPSTGLVALSVVADQVGQGAVTGEFNKAIQRFDLNADEPRSGILGSAGANYTFRMGIQTGATPSGGEAGKEWFSRLQFSPTNSGDPLAANNFSISQGKLYVLAVYMSSPSATGAAHFPQTRISMGLEESQNEFGIYELDPSAATGLTTTAKAYYCVAEPQYQAYAPGSGTVTGNIFIDFLSNTAEAYTASEDIVISRVVVSEYANGR